MPQVGVTRSIRLDNTWVSKYVDTVIDVSYKDRLLNAGLNVCRHCLGLENVLSVSVLYIVLLSVRNE